MSRPVPPTAPLALLVAQPPDGGVHKHVRQLAIGLVGRGWRVLVAGPKTYARLGAGIEHVRLDMVRPITPRDDVQALRTLGALVRRERPALVHAHSAKAGALARVLGPLLGIPVVYSPHGYAHAGFFTSDRARWLYRAVELALAPATTRVVCACEAEREVAVAVVRRARTRVAHNGVELVPPGPVDRGAQLAAQLGPVVSVIAGLRGGKGVGTAVEALALVHDRRPDAQLVVAGDGPERLEVETLARRLGVAGSVHLLGALDDPATMLRAATIHVSASWAESFPFAVLEGMAAGLPVVATDVGGTREAVLEEGRTGVLVPARDPQALADALLRMLDEPETARRMGETGRDVIASTFTVEAMVDGVVAAYAEIVPRT